MDHTRGQWRISWCSRIVARSLPSKARITPAKASPHRSPVVTLSFSLLFNGHFPGEPGLAGVYWSKGWWRWWVVTTGAIGRAKLQSNHHHQQTNIQIFTGQTGGYPSCRPTNSVKALNGKISHSMDLPTPGSPGGLPTLSLTTNSSWLPWGRVAMPLISPLMPVPQQVCSE